MSALTFVADIRGHELSAYDYAGHVGSSLSVTLTISIKGAAASNMFEALFIRDDSIGPNAVRLAGNGAIVVGELSAEAIRRALDHLLSDICGDTWEQCLITLRQRFHWEFEGFSSIPAGYRS